MSEAPLLVWEDCTQSFGTDNMYRAKVPGGWLVKSLMDIIIVREYGNMQQGYDWRAALVFIPDPLHTWGTQSTGLPDVLITVLGAAVIRR